MTPSDTAKQLRLAADILEKHADWTETKPDTPPFQLPPPPPNMRWHRTDGWQEGDLPLGYRPCALGEIGEYEMRTASWVAGAYPHDPRPYHSTEFYRTRLPLTFTHEGKTWTWHRPGDPMPCDGSEQIEVFWRTMPDSTDFTFETRSARVSNWAKNTTIIGWRYADEKKTVPLGPEDVRCGDELLMAGKRYAILTVTDHSVEYLTTTGAYQITFEWLHKNAVKIRRRDANAWEPCHKEITA